VTDENAARHSLPRHDVGDGAPVGEDAGLARFRGAPPVAGEIEGDDAVAGPGETSGDIVPAPCAVTGAVNEHEFLGHRGSGAGLGLTRADRPSSVGEP
jgi:hypothetical protein